MDDDELLEMQIEEMHEAKLAKAKSKPNKPRQIPTNINQIKTFISKYSGIQIREAHLNPDSAILVYKDKIWDFRCSTGKWRVIKKGYSSEWSCWYRSYGFEDFFNRFLKNA